MRTVTGFVAGFAVGVLALGVVLYTTGKLKTEPRPEQPTAAALPTVPAPDVSMPKAAPLPLPAPPEPVTIPVGNKATGIGLPLPNLQKGAIRNTFDDTRGGGTKHEAADIMAPRGTPVLAVVEGNVVKLFNSKKGGITVYQYDNQRRFCYYYAHLDRYAEGLKEGMLLRKGETLGYVGSTGDARADAPHLHFAILELGPDKLWYRHTTAINPYPILMSAFDSK